MLIPIAPIRPALHMQPFTPAFVPLVGCAAPPQAQNGIVAWNREDKSAAGELPGRSQDKTASKLPAEAIAFTYGKTQGHDSTWDAARADTDGTRIQSPTR